MPHPLVGDWIGYHTDGLKASDPRASAWTEMDELVREVEGADRASLLVVDVDRERLRKAALVDEQLFVLKPHLVVSVERLWQDLRHGARVFARNPSLTLISIVSIAFGTGANVAIFSMTDALLLRPLLTNCRSQRHGEKAGLGCPLEPPASSTRRTGIQSPRAE